jgi:HAD superfamily hydrolase (TIGR01490 family)
VKTALRSVKLAAHVSRPAALFDLDRTLVACNTGRLLIGALRRAGHISLPFALRSVAWMIQYRLGQVDLDYAAERSVALMRGHRADAFAEFCQALCERSVFSEITAEGVAAIARHRARNETVAIVSSSSEQMVRPVAEKLGVALVVCTHLQVADDGCFTGKLAGRVCWGQGKREAAVAFAQTHDIDLNRSTFYSDSATDLPLLESVGHPVVVNPDGRLRRYARKNTWPIERWHPQAE